jgi:beta-lactamase superfamily II metal-dependent hydrolase
VLERLSGTKIFRTDRDGAVAVMLSEKALLVKTERSERRRYWHDAAL